MRNGGNELLPFLGNNFLSLFNERRFARKLFRRCFLRANVEMLALLVCLSVSLNLLEHAERIKTFWKMFDEPVEAPETVGDSGNGSDGGDGSSLGDIEGILDIVWYAVLGVIAVAALIMISMMLCMIFCQKSAVDESDESESSDGI